MKESDIALAVHRNSNEVYFKEYSSQIDRYSNVYILIYIVRVQSKKV